MALSKSSTPNKFQKMSSYETLSKIINISDTELFSKILLQFECTFTDILKLLNDAKGNKEMIDVLLSASNVNIETDYIYEHLNDMSLESIKYLISFLIRNDRKKEMKQLLENDNFKNIVGLYAKGELQLKTKTKVDDKNVDDEIYNRLTLGKYLNLGSYEDEFKNVKNIDTFMKLYGNSLFVLAVNQRNLSNIKFILDKGADINYETDGKNILMITKFDIDIAEYLIEKGLYVNHRDNSGNNLLYYVINSVNITADGKIKIIKLLMDKNIYMNNTNNRGLNTIAEYLCKNHNIDKVILNFLFEHIKNTDNYNYSLAYFERINMGYQPDCETINILIKNGANFNVCASSNRTILHLITQKYSDCLSYYNDVISTFINCGVDINAIDGSGMRCLDLQINGGLYPENTLMLLNFGAISNNKCYVTILKHINKIFVYNGPMNETINETINEIKNKILNLINYDELTMEELFTIYNIKF
jgi:hypothetical protein